jgi:hypothetical protein
VRRLADRLLDDQAAAGVYTAELVERADTECWTAALPWVASLAAEGRALAGELARLRAVSVPAAATFAAPETVPPVVWAREIGVTQRLVLVALREIEHAAPGPDTVAVLTGAAQRVRSVVRGLAGTVAA